MSAGYDDLRWKIHEAKRSLAVPEPPVSCLRTTIWRVPLDKDAKPGRIESSGSPSGYRVPTRDLAPTQNEHSRNKQ
jgi:hypothetical protein